MTDIRSLERTLLDNLPWNKASIKFLVRFLLALYDSWTVNREASASRILLANSPNKELMRFIRLNLKNLRGGD